MEFVAVRVLRAGALIVMFDTGLTQAQPVPAPTPDPFTQFAVDVRDGQVVVNCRLSLDPELARLVIRYRTDGVCPADVNDGSPLEDFELPRDASAVAIERKPSGVASASSPCFAAFVKDHSGTLRGQATARVAPPESLAPEPATNLRRSSQP